ncbi:MAG: TolC family protein [Chitinophagaceae bacterium]|nr:TolC family protein [Chitinophagaceae bacterium]
MNGTVNRLQFLLPLFVLLPSWIFSQDLSLEKVQELARKNYPSIRQKDLIRKTADLNISNIGKNYLPQLSINGQASYQSDVTKIDVDFPGVKIDAPSKDQYKFTADINQLIYDGGATKHQKTLAGLNSKVEDQQVEVELYNLRERINDVYFGILYTDELIKQAELVAEDLKTGLKKVDAQVQNGVAFRSSSNLLKAELLKTQQRVVELRSNRKALTSTLAIFIGQPITEESSFKPAASTADTTRQINRPELQLFTNQQALFQQQNKLITAKNLPKTSLFFQGGYGRPALNLLKNDFEPFYITGVRLNWSLSGLYTKKNEKAIVKLNQDIIEAKRETFLMNTNAQLESQQSEIEKLETLVESDNEIIDLRKSVTTAAKAQLENGVMTASDYLVEVNAEDQARQVLIAHEIQLQQARIKYQTIKGQ